MAYEKYTTDALILDSLERGEADKVLVLYTRDFGLLYARVSGVRRGASRLRPALQSYARAHVSLVRGKIGWRIVGAQSVAVPPKDSVEGAAVFSRIAKLLRRLVHGEESMPHLFDTIAHAHAHFLRGGGNTGAIELVCVARVLHVLGYLPAPRELARQAGLPAESLGSALFVSTTYEYTDIENARVQERVLLAAINEAISESQL